MIKEVIVVLAAIYTWANIPVELHVKPAIEHQKVYELPESTANSCKLIEV
jgi:hypothetical protein